MILLLYLTEHLIEFFSLFLIMHPVNEKNSIDMIILVHDDAGLVAFYHLSEALSIEICRFNLDLVGTGNLTIDSRDGKTSFHIGDFLIARVRNDRINEDLRFTSIDDFAIFVPCGYTDNKDTQCFLNGLVAHADETGSSPFEVLATLS